MELERCEQLQGRQPAVHLCVARNTRAYYDINPSYVLDVCMRFPGKRNDATMKHGPNKNHNATAGQPLIRRPKSMNTVLVNAAYP